MAMTFGPESIDAKTYFNDDEGMRLKWQLGAQGQQAALDRKFRQQHELPLQQYGIDQQRASQRDSEQTNRFQIQAQADTQRIGQNLDNDTRRHLALWDQQTAFRGQDATERSNNRADDTNRFQAQLGFDATTQGNQLGADTARYQSDQNNATTREGNQLASDTARRGQQLQFEASMAPVRFAQDRFNQVFPMFQQEFQGVAAGGGSAPGGQNTPIPGVSVGGVFSPEQTAQAVNAERARNAMQAQTDQRLLGERMAGRGMSAGSPLLQALGTQIDARRMMADGESARAIRRSDAEANARQQTAGESLRGQLWAQDNAMEIDRRREQTNRQTALLAALGGLI